ncbi:BZ3500_MvSof-1268-A1-R1_Chr3-1g05426 [Microbotryum saponariae]|uniref:BZ3500_MvSof-1268-A1-R1_Chr3-1g05426 protein n=1 Tax=Microbotryum saponariae TaxID=289078 RepID=A0A2X0LQL7_9BASI|nr:BZ3500_MvSof-1268-A1-R1_Chr3-1g05426 [Microbotryum saponariae]SDA04617.1 BZ3501_MvSof-1269-A2-R1_Chr3-1g05097 [Microbotryum saponariae]
MHPRSSILEPQQRQRIEERIDRDARLVWANGRWVFKKRVLEGSATLAPKARTLSSTINTSKFTPPTPRAPAPRTECARSNPRSQHAITAARRRRRARSRSRRKSTPSTTTQSPTRNESTPPPKGVIRPSRNLIEAVPKGADPMRPALSKSLTAAEHESTTYQVRTIRAAKVTTTAKQSSPAATRTTVLPKVALRPVPPTSHVSSFFDSNRSHLARAELAPTRPPIPSRSSAPPELSSNPVPQPDTAQINPRPCASRTTQILHSQLAHLRTTWTHQRRLHLLHHLLHHSHYPLSNPHRAGRLLHEPPSSPPTLSSLACLSPRTQVQLPSSSTSFYKLSWAAYQKLYNTGVSGKTLSKAERLFRACGREVFLQGMRTG